MSRKYLQMHLCLYVVAVFEMHVEKTSDVNRIKEISSS